MSLTFTKLFSSITESTVWCEPAHTRLVWITMLAMADRRGRIYASVPGLANRARVSLEDAEAALATFLAPDKYSRTTDNDGRRIKPIQGGWTLLNYAFYRNLRDVDARREYQLEWDREHRPIRQIRQIRPNPTESDREPTQAEAEAEAERLTTPNGVVVPDGTFPDCPHGKIVDLYHEKLPMCRKVVEWHEVRQGYLRARWKKAATAQWGGGYSTQQDGLIWWGAFFAYCAESEFLTGEAPARKDQAPFVADLEWIVRPTNFAKILEGKYHRL